MDRMQEILRASPRSNVGGADTGHCVVDEQNDDRTDYGNQDAVEIHASDAHVAKGIEEPSAHNSPDDS